MKFGFSLGRNKLIELLGSLHSIGVNHVIIGLKAGRRPASDVLEELGEHVVPRFPALQV